MEEKNYTLTEKELFDLIEYAKYSSFCATIIKAVQEYNADSEMMTDLFEAFMRAIEIGKGLPPKTEEISDTFHKGRMNKETTE